MKRRVEASNLWHRRRMAHNGSNRSEIVWLMQRRQWHKRFQIRKQLIIHTRRLEELRSAMHDAMTGRHQMKPTIPMPPPPVK